MDKEALEKIMIPPHALLPPSLSYYLHVMVVLAIVPPLVFKLHAPVGYINFRIRDANFRS